MTRNTSFFIALLVICVIFLLSNMIVNTSFRHVRKDLTEEKIYTLSEGTKNILSNISQNITLKFYYSRTEAAAIPFINNYATRVQDFLEEYKIAGQGKVIVEIYDPRPDTEDEEWAEKFGLQSVPLQSFSVYFGLAGLNESGDEDVISFFNPNREEFLEYDMTKLIYNLNNPEKKIIGLISSLKLLGQERNPYAPPGMFNKQVEPWIFTQELEQIYEIREIGATVKDIPDEIDTLLIVHPKQLPDETLFAIDQFVLKGGRSLIFVDPHCENDAPSHDPQKPYEAMVAKKDSDLEKLFNAWGVEMVKGKVIGDTNLSTNVNTGENKIAPYIVWLDLMEQNIARDDVITGKLENILMPYAGILKAGEKEGVTYTPLAQTTEDAMEIDAFKMNFSNPLSLLEEYAPGMEKQTLAMRVSGKFKTAFPNGRPISEDKKNQSAGEKPVTALKESSEEGNIVIVADVDMISDRFSVRIQNFLGQRIMFPINDNLNFLYNSIENLTGSNDLISIRSRGTYTRPFTKVEEIERAAEERWKDEERLLQQEVNTINSRLTELIKPGEKDKKQRLSKAIQKEISKYRAEKKKTQKKLREVRRKLREEKEALGNNLFVLNTFLIPAFICSIGIIIFLNKRRK